MSVEVLPPTLEHGFLHCPHCKCPLTIQEPRPDDYRCIYCYGRVGKMTDELLIRLVKELPLSTAREWLIEMRVNQRRIGI